MNTLNKVYNKLNSDNKTELANHKIELGLIDDALKYIKGVQVFGTNIDVSEDELEKTFRALKVDVEDLEGDLSALKKGISDVEAAAKELGVNPNDLPKYKDAIQFVKYGEKQINKGKNLLK